MKYRTITLVIILLVFASIAFATPTESTEYHDSEFFDEFGGYTTEAWNCVAPSFEPIADILYTTATNNQTSFDNNDHGTNLAPPNLPVQIEQDAIFDGQAVAFQPQSISHADLWYSSTPMVHQQPYVYPQSIEVPIDHTSLQAFTTGAMETFESPSVGLPGIAVQTWLDNAYVPGHGVQSIPPLPPSWPGLPQNPPDQLLQTTQPPSYTIQPPSFYELPTLQPMPPQDVSRSLQSGLTFGDDGWQHPDYTMDNIGHSYSDDVPVESGPHPLHFNQQILSPPEIQTHLSTRDLRRPHYCSFPSCKYATKGSTLR